MNIRRISLAACLLAPELAAADFFTGGRPIDPEKSVTVNITVGEVSEIEGGVTETSRQLFELEGRDPSTFEPESYTFEKLGLTDGDTTFGVSVEKMWRYFTLRGDIAYMRAEARSTPPRDFFIGVDEIKFEGQSCRPQRQRHRAVMPAKKVLVWHLARPRAKVAA